jgi:hypothetical protein
MRWNTVTARQLGALMAVYALTASLCGVLCLLAGAAIDPVRFIAPNGAADMVFRQHGKPGLSA